MTSFNKTFIKFTLAFLAIVLLVLGATLLAQYFQNKKEINNQMAQRPDEIVITELPTGEKLVENKTQGYSVIINKNFLAQPPSNTNDKGINILTDTNVGCSIYFNKIENKKHLPPLEYFKNFYGELIGSYSSDIKNIKNIDATIININSGDENGYSKNIYLPLNDVLYEIIAYSNKPLTPQCTDNLIKIIESAKF